MAKAENEGRTESPTGKRLAEARREGMIARTPELATWSMVLLATYLAPILVRKGYGLTAGLFYLGSGAMQHPNGQADIRVLGAGLSGITGIVLPVGCGMAALGVVVGLVQTRGALRFNQLMPKLSRLRPKVHGAIIFSPQSAWNTVKSLVRMTALGIVGWIDISRTVHTLMTGSGLDLFSTAAIAAKTALSFIRTIAVISLVVAVYDYRRAKRKLSDTLKMTRFEVRDEFKQQEGSPIVKSEIRRRFRRLTRLRMLQAVAKANTLVVNPTHVAVALQYETGLGAPRVVAKGTDELALRLRLEAEIHGVPIVRDVPLARALYGACEVGQEIPRDLYEAVARLLTFLYSLRRTGRLRRIDGAPHAPLGSFLPAVQARRLGLMQAEDEAESEDAGEGGTEESRANELTGAATTTIRK